MIVQLKDITKPVRESADVCIVGSGCGGGATAKILAERGKKVIVVEEGGYFTTGDFVASEEFAFTNLYRQRAGQATDDLSVTVLQGKCVGGSSTVNWTTSLRTPDFVLDHWVDELGIRGLSAKELEPYFERIERYLNIHTEPDENHNSLNRVILDGAKKLGYHALATGRNTKDCTQLGVCGFGCPIGAKTSVDQTYIPDAVRAGATVFSNFRADNIEIRGKQKRVRGTILGQSPEKTKLDFVIEAPVVVVAASAVASPVLLLKSNIPNLSSEVGKHLTFHVTTAVLGLFDRPMVQWKGIPQSAMCDEFLNKSGDRGGFWIEAVPATPTLASLAVPGFGHGHREIMSHYAHVGASIVLVKEIDSEGTVVVNDYGRPSISYSVGPCDQEYLLRGIRTAAEIHFAAGAREVMSLHARKTVFNSSDDVDRKLREASWGPNEIALYSAHPLGTCRMGKDPHNSVVNSNCQLHGVKGLFVIDGSVTPTSLGVNPQVTILAIAEKSAEWLADNFNLVAR